MTEPEIAQSQIEDQPPDPAAARAAALQARRMLAVSRGPLVLMMGIVSGILTIPAFIGRKGDLGNVVFLTWALSLGLLALLWPSIASRLGMRKGVLALTRGEKRLKEPVSPAMIFGMLAGILCAAGLACVAVVLPSSQGPWVGLGFLAIITLVVTSLLAWQAIRLKLWEMLLSAAMVAFLPVLYMLGRSSQWQEFPWWMLPWTCLWLLPSGISLCLRWRRWTRSLPRGESAETQA